MSGKKIWINVVDYTANENRSAENEMKSIVIPEDLQAKQIKKLFFETYCYDKKDVVLKLRNEKNSIIPINKGIPINAPSKPYKLEICNFYQSVQPAPRTVTVATYEQVLKRKMQNILSRLDKLEESIPQLPEMRRNKLEKEISEMSDVMNFLDNKIKKADECQWQGMFEKNPLW